MNALAAVIGAIISAILVITVVYPITNEASDPSDVLDVIIIDGQSNAAYNRYCDRMQIDLPVPNQKLMYYGSETAANYYPGTSSNGVYEMNRGGYWQIGGLEPGLAYYYSLNTDRPVLVVNVARNGTSISWLSQGEGLQYAKDTISAALEQVQTYKIRMAGWVMLQGENDKNMPIEEYKQYFMELQEYFSSIGANQCYIAGMRAQWGGNAAIAQTQLSEDYPDIHMATTVAETFDDGSDYVDHNDLVHYTQEGRNIIAEDVAEYMAEYIPSEDPEYKLLAIIPILILVGLLIGITTVIGRRMEIL